MTASGNERRSQSRTGLVLDEARRAAAETMLDRPLILVSEEAYRQFLARLDAPPKPNVRLCKSLRTPA